MMFQKMKMPSAFRKKSAGIRYAVCLVIALFAVVLKWYSPGVTERYAEKICGIIEGDADFASAAKAIQAWVNGDLTADTAVQEAARFAFGIAESPIQENELERIE